MCRSTQGKSSSIQKAESSTSKPVHQLFEDPCEAEYTLFPVQNNDYKPLQTTMMVEGHSLTMEVDTGAAVSLVSEETVNSSPFLMCLPLQQSNVALRTCTGQTVSVLDQLLVKVQHDEAQKTMPLQVVKGSSTTLLGRDWLQRFQLDCKTIFYLPYRKSWIVTNKF